MPALLDISGDSAELDERESPELDGEEREEGEWEPEARPRAQPVPKEPKAAQFKGIKVPTVAQLEWQRKHNNTIYKMCSDVARQLQDFRHKHCPSAIATQASIVHYNKVLKAVEHSIDLVKLADASPFDWEVVGKAKQVQPMKNASLSKAMRVANAEMKKEKGVKRPFQQRLCGQRQWRDYGFRCGTGRLLLTNRTGI